MKFELNLDKEGRPCIKFLYYDKEESLRQKILKGFIDSANKNGIELKCISRCKGVDMHSFTTYEIQIKNNQNDNK